MIEDFRRAVADVVEAAKTRPHDVLPLAGTLFQLAGHVPVEERSAALEAVAECLRAPEGIAMGAVADLAVLCGALIEMGTPAGSAGIEVTRRGREVGAHALRFAQAWESTGGDAPPHPRETGEPHRSRVAPVLGDAALYSLSSWATMQPYGIAIRAVLGDAGVRAALREDPQGLVELQVLSSQMRSHVEEFGEVHELLLMAQADRMLVLDRASGRAFRVRFDGVGDNFQLHTLLADALIGPEGRGVPGQRPMPDWVASATDLRDDPRQSIVEGEWDLVGGDGVWVGNETAPGAVPFVDGERVLVLEPPSLSATWRTGRRHPHIPGWLRVEEELGREEAAAWWGRVHPAGTVVHPLVQGREATSPVAEASAEGREPAGAVPEPDGPGSRDAPADRCADTGGSWDGVRASGGPGAQEGGQTHGYGESTGVPGADEAPRDRVPVEAPDVDGPFGGPGADGGPQGWPSAGAGADAPAGPGPYEPFRATDAAEGPGAYGAPEDGAATGAQASWDAPGDGGAGVPPGASLLPPPPADRWEAEAEPPTAGAFEADREPPGAGLLEPMPDGVSDSSGWGPSWKS